MSKRTRVPSPIFRNLPSVIRTSLPRYVLLATAAGALLIIGGGSYVISRATPSPAKTITKQPEHPDSSPSPASQAEVLGDATPAASASNSNEAAAPATSTTPATPEAAAGSTNPTTQTSTPAPVHISTTPKKTEVHVDTPVGSLLLDLPLGI